MKKEYMIIPVLFSGMIVICWEKILNFLVLLNIFSRERVQIYFESSGTLNREFIARVILLVLFICFFRYFRNENRKMRVYVYMYVIATVLGMMGFFVGQAKRLALYFDLPSVVLIGAIKCYMAKPKSTTLYRFIVFICSWLYFSLNYYVLRHTYLIPYNWK